MNVCVPMDSWGKRAKVELFSEVKYYTALQECNHRDHIKLEGALGPKIGVELNAAILSKLGRKLFFSRPFSVCSRTLRSNN